MNEMSGRFGSDDDALRSEDAPLLTGAGQFVDDLNIGGQAYGAFARHGGTTYSAPEAEKALALSVDFFRRHLD